SNPTSEQLQTLCHNLESTVSLTDFCAGCEAHQIKLYGKSPITQYREDFLKAREEAVQRGSELTIVRLKNIELAEALKVERDERNTFRKLYVHINDVKPMIELMQEAAMKHTFNSIVFNGVIE